MVEVADSLIEVDRLNRLAGIVILAGGASKRMGSPKAELILPKGERLLDYHVRQALELSAAMISNIPIMIADNGRNFTVNHDLIEKNPQSSISYITDYLSSNDNNQIETGGALVAIESALQLLKILVNAPDLTEMPDVKSYWLLVISCDSLIPVTDLWKKLKPYIAQATNKSVICLTDNEHLYPLLGLYRLDIEADLKCYLDDSQRQVMRFIKPIVKPVTLPQNWQYLTNFNTPNAFECACIALRDI